MAHRLLTNKTKRLALTHINIICKAINCTPNELFEWVPASRKDKKNNTTRQVEEAIPPGHHLNKIAPRNPSRLLEKLKNMTEEEIADLEAQLAVE